jgi:drug/metabolite transporter (DMT)-like permease
LRSARASHPASPRLRPEVELATTRAAPTGVALRAAALVVTACFFFAAANALARAVQLPGAGAEIPALQVTFCRFLFGFLALVPWILARGTTPFRTTAPAMHALRVACGVGGVACLFAALARLPLAEATAIAWANPLFAMLFAAWFLKDRVDARGWAAAAVGFAGVLVMLRPGAAAFAPAGLLALAAALFVGAEVVVIKALAGRDPPLTVLAISNLAGLVVSGLVAAPFLVWPAPGQALPLAAVGIVMVTGQLLFLKALTLRETSFVAPFYYATLLHAFLIGWLAFGETPSPAVLLGALLIVGAGLYVVTRGGRASAGTARSRPDRP